MCRHLLYLGRPAALAELLCGPPHSLLRQSWMPRDMRGGGTINADGFGVGWYQEGREAPVRYRRDCPMWADANFARIAEVTSSGAVLAAVRSGTVGMPLVETANAPFTEGRWLFSLNGVVAGWPDSVLKLAETLPVRDLLTLDAPSDAAFVWALVRHRLRQAQTSAGDGDLTSGPGGVGGTDSVGGVDSVEGVDRVGEVVARTVADIAQAAPGSRLNLLLTDGVIGVATAAGHSLWWRRETHGVLVMSEPHHNAAGWHEVPYGALAAVTASTVQIHQMPIGHPSPADNPPIPNPPVPNPPVPNWSPQEKGSL